VCESKGDERVESGDQDEVRAHRRLAALPFTSGGAAVLDLLSLAAFCLGFWRGLGADGEGIYMERLAWARG
jgi:hypothetical protein